LHELQQIQHGEEMRIFWRSRLEHAWVLKTSLRKEGKDTINELIKRGVPDALARLLHSSHATPESLLARLYAKEKKISQGTARNAIRAYQNWRHEKITNPAIRTK
jgi:hypothetical protein